MHSPGKRLRSRFCVRIRGRRVHTETMFLPILPVPAVSTVSPDRSHSHAARKPPRPPLLLAASFALVLYIIIQIARPFIFLYGHMQRARTVGLPIKVLPVPQGLFSFFALQILRRLHLVRPGTKLHKILNMGRPDGYELHKEMGDVFLTVNPYGISLLVADPKVVSYVTSRRSEFPKPPNTGAIINIYGRNVINADGDVWRFHRRVTGPVFSERIHGAVWDESKKQAALMMRSWDSSTATPSVRIDGLGNDALRLGLHVITGAAYGCPLDWDASPPATSAQNLSYRGAVDQLTSHLMPLFLTPRWLLKLAPRNTTWGRAWEAYEAFGSYMLGMLESERNRLRHEDGGDENLLTALIRSEEDGDEKEGRRMTREEVMGNAFIFLFAGHETTANTLHYSLLLLGLHPEVQQVLLDEVDTMYARAADEGRSELEYDNDFSRARWAVAVMYETLRLYTPTSIMNKWTSADQAIAFDGQEYVIPRSTRIAINGTGVHSNPKVWGADVGIWRPSRWIVEPSFSMSSPDCGSDAGSRPPTHRVLYKSKEFTDLSDSLIIPATTPTPASSYFLPRTPYIPSTPPVQSYTPQAGILKPPKGAFLPFSEGARACSGKKFATVEFVSVVFTLLRSHRVELVDVGDGWGAARVREVLAGRKAGALTLQPPEPIPIRFVRR